MDLAEQAGEFNTLCPPDAEITNLIKQACFDMLSSFLDFHIASIRYINWTDEELHLVNLALKGGKNNLQLIEEAFAKTMTKLKEVINRIKGEVPFGSQTGVQSPRDSGDASSRARSHCLIPQDLKEVIRFNRQDTFKQLDDILFPKTGRSFQFAVLHGMGGVGKSIIASAYAKEKFDEGIFNIVLWVHGERDISLRQSFTDIAIKLNLTGARRNNHDENFCLVRKWLGESTELKWLIVYDNFNFANDILAYWPDSTQGRAIVTTQQRESVIRLPYRNLEVFLWDTKDGSEFLLTLLGPNIGSDREAENKSALALSKQLSGHALTLSHIAGSIHQSEVSIETFAKHHGNDSHMNELSAIWNKGVAFSSFDKDTLNLAGVLSFLMPDSIGQDLFETSRHRGFPKDLDFCVYKPNLWRALTNLRNRGLIKRDKDENSITIHRVVQTQLKKFLDRERRQQSFNNTVTLLCGVFPEEKLARQQLYSLWDICSLHYQHILNLADCFKEEIEAFEGFKGSVEFCDLLTTCQRFLSEINEIKELQNLCEINLRALDTLENGPKKMDLKASILSHQAQALESLGDPVKAIELNIQVWKIRFQEDPKDKIMLRNTANNLGYCHSTANRHEESQVWHEKSRYWWQKSIEDEETLNITESPLPKRCSKNLSLDFKNNPKARQCLDTTLSRRHKKYDVAETHYKKAQSAWLKGDKTRIHPFNAACLYKIGACCLDQGKVEEAIAVEHARTLFKLSQALLRGNSDETQEKGAKSRKEAEIMLREAKPDVVSWDTEDAYDRFVPIFWR
ncbi:hypothetical protein QQS21_006666 [Conoideocrella luteorostrata]|uniref:NB-ARC domain-containing protein n=1 Tax=Conoideocrella luteorostrata TaxID=1105319 RepID=A0AAJ0FXS6_9HYPO|nr:hypothetical protein QQS21_006666 [Conoideocrella luteorostrata]